MTVLLFRGAAPKNPEWVVEFLSVLKPPWLFRYLETGIKIFLHEFAIGKVAADIIPVTRFKDALRCPSADTRFSLRKTGIIYLATIG